GVTFTAQVVIDNISDNRVLMRNPYTTQLTRRSGIDLIVDWQGAQSNNPLARATPVENQTLHAIGDCVSPRNVEIAMAEALATAEAI
ncbi:MAG: hypothetical protein AAF404_20845, partial [Pseudomonadota bacterium]